MAFTKYMISEKEFNRFMEYIKNPNENQRRDNFRYKFGLVVCNEFYANKAGL